MGPLGEPKSLALRTGGEGGTGHGGRLQEQQGERCLGQRLWPGGRVGGMQC